MTTSPRIPLLLLVQLACGSTPGPLVPSGPPLGALTRLGDLTEGRSLHTATLLADGHVLVTGGMGARGLIRSAELYDADSGKSRATGSLAVGRMSHTATLLPDGKVLIVGGYGSGLAGSGTAELYDPSTGGFAATGALNEPHADHVAVLLDDGRVLIVGGDTSGAGRTPTAVAELYDPATGRFTPTGSMHVSRVPYGAVRLRDGRVLVAGGTTTGKAVTASAEIYDPLTGWFSLTGCLRTARRKHAGFLLPDGRVLIVGGTTGGNDDTVLRDAELFDPVQGRFSPAPPLLDPRFKFTAAALPGGLVLVVGGAEALAEVYDPRAGQFRPVVGAAALRLFPTATALADGAVLVTGGYSDRGSQPTVWRYRAEP
jgi:hypothetical protein